MKLLATDYFLCRLAQRSSGVLKMLGDLETEHLRRQLEEIGIDRPVFITGLARSGTTILLDLFSKLEPVGTHRYRDFPFLFTPWWWSWCNDHLGRVEEPVERPHKDRIRITKESPEAFEEPIWRHFFPFLDDPHSPHLLDDQVENAPFETFFRDHIRKILLLRGKTRYVSKGNYNLTRLQYLAKLFPDARFVIPIRHPLDHVESLVRQHRLFTAYSEEDERVPQYLRAAGHCEFGPQRVPINVDRAAAARIEAAWERRDDALGYAIAWQTLYGHVRTVACEGGLRDRIEIVRYEDFCAAPASVLTALFRFCELGEHAGPLLRSLPEISAPQRAAAASADVWQAVASVAESFGYARDGARPLPRGAALQSNT